MKTAAFAVAGGGPLKDAVARALAGKAGLSGAQEHMDLFVYVIEQADVGSRINDMDDEGLEAAYDTIALGLLRQVSAALPLLEKGSGKRLCFVTGPGASINLARDRTGGYGDMVGAACHMAVHTLYNRLRPMGYTFRVFAPEPGAWQGEALAQEAACAADYFLSERSSDCGCPQHSDEDRLVMRNRWEQEIPW